MRRYSLADIVNWRRYMICVIGTLPVSLLVVALDSLLGTAPWTFWGVYAVYLPVAMWWFTR